MAGKEGKQLFPSSRVRRQAVSGRPSILILMADELRADVVGYEGNRIVRTPYLDHLAATGVVFRHAYTPSPVCIPARQCIMAGQLPKTCGCEGWFDLKPGHMTFARQFARHAYATVACGRLHHLGTDQMQGWTRRIGSEIYVSSDHIEGKVREDFLRYDRPFADYKWSDAEEIRRAGIGRGPNGTADEYTVEGALHFIEDYFISSHYDREQRGRPLLLKISLVQPHYPYLAAEQKFKYYLNRVRPFLGQTLSDHPFLRQRHVLPGRDATEREIRRATAAYYAMVETVDGLAGRVLEALEAAGENLDEWIVVQTADHGEMLGEHGVWEKQKFYEGSVRVPLLIRWPAGFTGGRAVQENVGLCDLFATLCDLAGIPVPQGLDSRSLVPLIRGNADSWSGEAVSEFSKTNTPLLAEEKAEWEANPIMQFGGMNLMIKQDQLKYQYYGPAMPEVLFDLGKDPGEARSFIDDPGYAQAAAKFRNRCAELGFGPQADPDYVNAGYGESTTSPGARA